jgi:hypothetical protein
MSIEFMVTGNSTVIAGNATSGNTVVTIARSAAVPQIGCFMIDNLDTGNVAIVNIGSDANLRATLGNATPGTASGFSVSAYATKYITFTGSSLNQTPDAQVYVAVTTTSGTANVMVTPIYIAGAGQSSL